MTRALMNVLVKKGLVPLRAVQEMEQRGTLPAGTAHLHGCEPLPTDEDGMIDLAAELDESRYKPDPEILFEELTLDNAADATWHTDTDGGTRYRAVEAVWLQKGRRDQRLQRVVDAARTRGVALRWVSRARLDALSGSGPHNGCAARCGPVALARLDDVLRPDGVPGRLLLVDDVTDPHNLGAVVRTAAAFAVDGLVVAGWNWQDTAARPGLSVGTTTTSFRSIPAKPLWPLGTLPARGFQPPCSWRPFTRLCAPSLLFMDRCLPTRRSGTSCFPRLNWWQR